MSCEQALKIPRQTAPSGLKIILVSAGVLIDTDGRILMAQRPEGKTMAGLWEFPGGKVQPGESPEFALCRELEEELGLDLRESCLSPIAFASHAYETFHLLMPVYTCRMWNGDPVPREGQAIKWVKPNDLYDLPMPPADIPLISQIIDRI